LTNLDLINNEIDNQSLFYLTVALRNNAVRNTAFY